MKIKQLYPFTNYSPKTEKRLKRMFLLADRGTLRRTVQDALIAATLETGREIKDTITGKELKRFTQGNLRYRGLTATTLTDEEVRKLHPNAEIIKRGKGGVTIKLPNNSPRCPKRKTPRITPKTPRLKR